MQYAWACGSEVWVTSLLKKKIAKAVALGAKGGVNYTTPDWHKTFTDQKLFFDVVVDGAAGPGFQTAFGV